MGGLEALEERVRRLEHAENSAVAAAAAKGTPLVSDGTLQAELAAREKEKAELVKKLAKADYRILHLKRTIRDLDALRAQP